MRQEEQGGVEKERKGKIWTEMRGEGHG